MPREFDDAQHRGADMAAGDMTFPQDLADEYLAKGWWRPETLDTWLARAVDASPDATALIHPGGEITYADLEAVVGATASGLAALGIAQGDVVATQLPNTAEFLIALLAITRLGAVNQTIHMPYGPKDIEFHLAHSRAKAVVSLARIKDTDVAAMMLGLKDKLDTLEQVIVVGDAPENAHSFASLAESGQPPATSGPAGPADPCMLLYTSGTTSNPKGVPLAFQNLMCNTGFGAEEFDITSDDRILSAAPFSHLYGIFNFYAGFSKAAASVLLPVFTPPDLAASVAEHRPTVLFMAPAHAAALVGGGLMEGHDFSSIRLTVFSGAACPPELLRAYQGQIPDSRIAQLWGMTELAAGSFTRRDDGIERALTTAGPATLGNEVRVLSPNGAPLPPGEEGELQIKGPSVFSGYLDNEAANAEAFDGDWFRTGDLATLDAEGYVSLTGRSKDIINRGGVKYNPADIEALLLRHDNIDQAAIVPMPDEVLGERACCFVVTAGAVELSLEEVCAYLEAENVTKLKWPERLEIVDEMPLTPTRKIIKGRLAALLT